MGVFSLSLVMVLAEAAAQSPARRNSWLDSACDRDRVPGSEPPVTLEDIAVTADEPRYVAPTRRDKIGRIWAPVSVNGKGPFRLVLDTGASHSALTARVAQELGITLDPSHTVMLRGATGSAEVPFVPVETLEFGDLLVEPKRLPIVPDALGGAEGVLGTDGLAKQAHPHRFPAGTTSRSCARRTSAPRAATRRFRSSSCAGGCWSSTPILGGVPVKAVIDTGGQATLGNVALGPRSRSTASAATRRRCRTT